jgi:hypothetical protein
VLPFTGELALQQHLPAPARVGARVVPTLPYPPHGW